MKHFWFGFLIVPLLAGQGGPAPSFRGPLMGWLFDSSARQLRPVWGVPGASLLGGPLEGPALAGAGVSPRGDYALVTDAEGSAAILRLPGGELAPLAVGTPSLVALSPSGTAAALYSAEGGSLQVVTGLPGAPAVGAMPYDAGTAPTVLAVSDDGEAVLAVCGETLLLVGREGARSLAVPGAAAALNFRAGTHDVAVATAGGEIWLIEAPDGEPRYRRIAGPEHGIEAPRAVAFSRDGTRVYVAGAAGAAVVDPGRGLVTAIPCSCEPAGLSPLDGDSLFLLTAAGPVVLLDASGAEPRTWLVPPSLGEEDR